MGPAGSRLRAWAGAPGSPRVAPPQLLPSRGFGDILEDQVDPDDPLLPVLLGFPGSFDVLSPPPDSEGLASVFSALPSLGSGPPGPGIFSADLSDYSGARLWDLMEDRW